MNLYGIDLPTVVVLFSSIFLLVLGALQARKRQDARKVMWQSATDSIDLEINQLPKRELLRKGNGNNMGGTASPSVPELPSRSKFYLRGPRKTRGEKGIGIARVVSRGRDGKGNPVVRLMNESGTTFQRLTHSGDVWDPPASE